MSDKSRTEYFRKYRKDNPDKIKRIRLDYYKRTLEKEQQQEQQQEQKEDKEERS